MMNDLRQFHFFSPFSECADSMKFLPMLDQTARLTILSVWCDFVTMATASSSVGRHGGHWFPLWFIWPLFFLTSALRVQYVMRPSNWWILHPDEIYQTMEGDESYCELLELLCVIYTSLCLSVCLSLSASLCLSVCLSLCASLSVCLSLVIIIIRIFSVVVFWLWFQNYHHRHRFYGSQCCYCGFYT